MRTILVVVLTLAIVVAACGAVLALSAPTPDADASPAKAALASTAQTTASRVTTSAASPSDYPPDPARVSTSRAQYLGEVAETALQDAGLQLAEAVEFTPPGSTDPVEQMLLRPVSPESQAVVQIWVFKTPEQDAVPSSTRDAGTLGSDEGASIPGYGSEAIEIPGASSAYCVTGPFGSYCQIVAQSPSGMTVNVCSESGLLRGGRLPLERAEVEKLVALLLGEP
jgi:hypothetical protein